MKKWLLTAVSSEFIRQPRVWALQNCTTHSHTPTDISSLPGCVVAVFFRVYGAVHMSRKPVVCCSHSDMFTPSASFSSTVGVGLGSSQQQQQRQQTHAQSFVFGRVWLYHSLTRYLCVTARGRVAEQQQLAGGSDLLLELLPCAAVHAAAEQLQRLTRTPALHHSCVRTMMSSGHVRICRLLISSPSTLR